MLPQRLTARVKSLITLFVGESHRISLHIELMRLENAIPMSINDDLFPDVLKVTAVSFLFVFTPNKWFWMDTNYQRRKLTNAVPKFLSSSVRAGSHKLTGKISSTFRFSLFAFRVLIAFICAFALNRSNCI